MDCSTVKKDLRAIKDHLHGRKHPKHQIDQSRIDRYAEQFDVKGVDSRKRLKKVGRGLQELSRQCDRGRSHGGQIVIQKDRLRDLGVDIDDAELRRIEMAFLENPTKAMQEFQKTLERAIKEPETAHYGVSSVVLKQWFAQARGLLVDVISHLTETPLNAAQREKVMEHVGALLIGSPNAVNEAKNFLTMLRRGSASITLMPQLDALILATSDPTQKLQLQQLKIMATDPQKVSLVQQLLDNIFATSLRSAGLPFSTSLMVTGSDTTGDAAEREQVKKVLHELVEMAQTITDVTLKDSRAFKDNLSSLAKDQTSDYGHLLRRAINLIRRLRKLTLAQLDEKCRPSEKRSDSMTFQEAWNQASAQDCKQLDEQDRLLVSMLEYLCQDSWAMGVVGPELGRVCA